MLEVTRGGGSWASKKKFRLRSLVHSLNVVLILNLLPILFNFSDIPGAYGIVAVP